MNYYHDPLPSLLNIGAERQLPADKKVVPTKVTWRLMRIN